MDNYVSSPVTFSNTNPVQTIKKKNIINSSIRTANTF